MDFLVVNSCLGLLRLRSFLRAVRSLQWFIRGGRDHAHHDDADPAVGGRKRIFFNEQLSVGITDDALNQLGFDAISFQLAARGVGTVSR